MDTIKAEIVDTLYGYKDLNILINDIRIDKFLYHEIGEEKLLGLYPAWGIDLLCKEESSAIWKVIDSDINLYNLPILLCPDDLDFTCIIVCAKVRKTESEVEWCDIGIVSHENYDSNKELASGILDTSKWTDDYWNKYAGTLAWCEVGDKVWSEWISSNWNEEKRLRLENYTMPYIQDGKNIRWCNIRKLTFSFDEYNKCINVFRNEQG